ncbi:hypothetical protein [Crateriforma conspicua]|uniref:Uncharacterized protein n=1 Tax=Crateriforma conspicua TaxID=2527996 RepID=A0A5C5Y195_9PLAN|nr:hypothetical protein [Crateriforma conspicua]TWT68401.1 hypothetical protein Pan14r_06460 [Crateriforma conspicua]
MTKLRTGFDSMSNAVPRPPARGPSADEIRRLCLGGEDGGEHWTTETEWEGIAVLAIDCDGEVAAWSFVADECGARGFLDYNSNAPGGQFHYVGVPITLKLPSIPVRYSVDRLVARGEVEVSQGTFPIVGGAPR